MRKVAVQQFQAQAADLLAGDEALAVECDGKLLGYYIPAPAGDRAVSNGRTARPERDEAAVQQARQRLEETIERICTQSGLTEDELAALFDSAASPRHAIGR